MLYEVRTYRLKPRGVPEFINTFGKAYEKRQSLSKIAAFFHTEIGPLNEVIHIWPYKDGLERDKKRAKSVSDKKYSWPPKVAHLQEHMQSELFTPSPQGNAADPGEQDRPRSAVFAAEIADENAMVTSGGRHWHPPDLLDGKNFVRRPR